MLTARLIDEKIIVLYKQNKCRFQIGVAGHEAIQVAIGHTLETGRDWFFPYYRDMALVYTLGMPMRDFFLNAMNKADDPNSHGRQMPMHYGSSELRIISQSSPTGSQFNQAIGCALASTKKGLNEVTYVSTGEGACAQGDFHEALNWSSRDKLPVILLVQNNGFAISVPAHEQLSGSSVYGLSAGYTNLERLQIDGTDYAVGLTAARFATERARKGLGPTLIEAFVPRIQSHSISDDHHKYRSEAEIAAEKARCPIGQLAAKLLSRKLITKKELEEIRAELQEEIDVAASWADGQAEPDPERATEFTFSDDLSSQPTEGGTPEGAPVHIVDALNRGLREELERDDSVYIFGQDVAHGKGGVFSVTTGLTEQFGNERVFNSQLAESSIAGVALGMAVQGLRPVVEVQFGDYIWTAMMQIRNELAMLHYRSGGDFRCPAVLRIPVGGYIRGACYHSQCIEGTFAHFPGLFIIMPSNATDAKGLLKSAIRCDNPVLFLEHKGLYRQVFAQAPEGDADYLLPIGKARVVQEGTDLSIITWGMLVHKAVLAAEELREEGFSVEIIDLRTIVPLDTTTVFESVKKTNRALVIHEDVQFMGFGAEVAAQISEHCFEDLDAPVQRIGMKYAAGVPHSPILEEAILPQTSWIRSKVKEMLSY